MSDLTQDQAKIDTSSAQVEIPVKPVVLKGDFARGERTLPADDAAAPT